MVYLFCWKKHSDFMLIKMSKTFAFLFIGTLFMAGCSKNSTPAKTKTDIITTSAWKYSTAGVDTDNNGTIEVTLPAGTVPACVTDNTITFRSDKSGTIDEGASKCEASAPQNSPFKWELTSNDTQLTLSTPIVTGFGNDAKVVELSETKFVLSKTMAVAGFPVPVPIVIVLVH
jgi:hypothetical protein